MSDWNQYFSNVNDKLSSIRVDLGLENLLPMITTPDITALLRSIIYAMTSSKGNQGNDERRSRVLSERIRVLALAAE